MTERTRTIVELACCAMMFTGGWLALSLGWALLMLGAVGVAMCIIGATRQSGGR